MDLIYNSIFLEHDTGNYPENKKRLLALDEFLGGLNETEFASGEEYLSLVHDQEYVDTVRQFCERGERNLDPDTRISRKSYEAAIYAVGATIKACEQNDFAVVRPPGHHAHVAKASGFCLFNNVAIAAQYLVDQGKKVLIFDFDGHLGDGTEKYFYNSKNVMYFSLHQFPAFPFWGAEDEIGADEARGYTVNVPLPPKSGDDVYLKAIKHLMPVAKQFDPDVVAVSAGFDAHQADPLLDLRLSAGAFHRTGEILRENFTNIFATLEGGYDLKAFPGCLMNFVSGINGEEECYQESPTDSCLQVIDEFELRMSALERNLSPFWKI